MSTTICIEPLSNDVSPIRTISPFIVLENVNDDEILLIPLSYVGHSPYVKWELIN